MCVGNLNCLFPELEINSAAFSNLDKDTVKEIIQKIGPRVQFLNKLKA